MHVHVHSLNNDGGLGGEFDTCRNLLNVLIKTQRETAYLQRSAVSALTDECEALS